MEKTISKLKAPDVGAFVRVWNKQMEVLEVTEHVIVVKDPDSNEPLKLSRYVHVD